jgi:hypothetical protein
MVSGLVWQLPMDVKSFAAAASVAVTSWHPFQTIM